MYHEKKNQKSNVDRSLDGEKQISYAQNKAASRSFAYARRFSWAVLRQRENGSRLPAMSRGRGKDAVRFESRLHFTDLWAYD